jgi:transposase-like protein
VRLSKIHLKPLYLDSLQIGVGSQTSCKSYQFFEPLIASKLINSGPSDFSSRFKFQVIMEVVKGSKIISQRARAYGVHPITITHWKKEFFGNGPEIFGQKYTDPLRRWTPPRDRVYTQTWRWKDETQEVDG